MRTIAPSDVRVSNVVIQNVVRMDEVRLDSAPEATRELFKNLPAGVIWRSIYLDSDDGLVMYHDPIKYHRRDRIDRTGFYFPRLKCGISTSFRARRVLVAVIRLTGFEVTHNVETCLSEARFITFHRGWKQPVVKVKC